MRETVLRLLRFFEKAVRLGGSTKIEPSKQRKMTEADEAHLLEKLDFSFIAAHSNIRLMSQFTAESREEFALKTKSMVLYFADEVRLIRLLEEQAALCAVPGGYTPSVLNGINIGCGDRSINEYLTPVDLMRESQFGEASGEHHAFLPNALLANPEDLPFKSESLDYIVALHMLEHVANPMEILRYWGSLLKPGGGIGLVLPNFRYTWNAHGDSSKFGHKWNTSAEIFRALFDRHLQEHFFIERIDTLPYKISFDVVLRRHGEFVPFSISNATSQLSGAELAHLGTMVSDHL